MLVLTRKLGEEILIDGHITVTITSIDRNKVRIGISAPPEVSIDRAELRQRKQEFALEFAGEEALEFTGEELVGAGA